MIVRLKVQTLQLFPSCKVSQGQRSLQRLHTWVLGSDLGSNHPLLLFFFFLNLSSVFSLLIGAANTYISERL